MTNDAHLVRSLRSREQKPKIFLTFLIFFGGGCGGSRQKMERKFLVLLRRGRFGTIISMEILSLIKFVLIQVFGLAISLIAAGLFIFWIIRKFHSWKIAAAFSVILVGISFFL